MNKEIYEKLLELKKTYSKEGINIIGIFGSYKDNSFDDFSDIDISYKINYPLFFSKYKDGFSQILRIEEIKNEISKKLNKKIDLVPYKKEFEVENV